MWFHNDILGRLAPEWRVDVSEAQTLADRLAAYLRHTSVRMDPKTKDLYLLIMVLVVMEGPRISRIQARRSMQKNAAKMDQAARDAGGQPNVIPMPAGPFGSDFRH